jgi:hypothetical protein
MATELSDEYKYLTQMKIINLDTDTIKLILMAPGFTFLPGTHVVLADVVASELPTANGYTAGGQTLANSTVTKDTSLHQSKTTFDNVIWTVITSTLTARGAIIYDDTVASPVVDPIIGYLDFGDNVATLVGGTFTVAKIAITHK